MSIRWEELPERCPHCDARIAAESVYSGNADFVWGCLVCGKLAHVQVRHIMRWFKERPDEERDVSKFKIKEKDMGMPHEHVEEGIETAPDRPLRKRFAIGQADFFNNDLVIEVIEAPSLPKAIMKHSAFNKPNSAADYAKWFKDMPFESLEAIKQFFFDGDMLVSAVEIK